MKQMDVFKKIGGILKELNDQYDYLKADSNDLNELELELFVANAHFLKDHAEILRRLHERQTPPVQLQLPPAEPEPVIEKPRPAPQPEYKQESVHERRYFEPVVQQSPIPEGRLEIAKEPQPVNHTFEKPVPVEIKQPEPVEEEPVAQIDLSENTGDSYSFEMQEPDTLQQELVLEEAYQQEEEPAYIEPIKAEEKPQPIAEVITEPKRPIEQAEPKASKPVATQIEDKPNNDGKVLTLNQKMFAQRTEKENGATAQPAALPITDLKSAINLNDKLLYIKDLFNGYSLAYSEAIEIVNRFNTFEEAERFLKTNYVVKNNWETKPVTSEKFYALLRRRYPV